MKVLTMVSCLSLLLFQGEGSISELERRLSMIEKEIERLEDARVRLSLGLDLDPSFAESVAGRPSSAMDELKRKLGAALEEVALLKEEERVLEMEVARLPAKAEKVKKITVNAEVPKPGPSPPPSNGTFKKKRKVERVAKRYKVKIDKRFIARKLYRAGRYVEALNTYMEYYRNGNKDPDILFMIALCMEKTGKRKEALNILEDLKNGHPGTPWEKAAVFAMESIQWLREYEARYPVLEKEGGSE